MERKRIEKYIYEILKYIGEDPERDGLRDTPKRVERMYREFTEGYRYDPEKIIKGAIFEVDYDEMVLLRDIEFYSLCEHHLLPFFGVAHVAYIPKGKVIGVSKIARIVDLYSRRLQIQERMTMEIAKFLMDKLKPYGVGVVIEGIHTCMMVRGVKKAKPKLVTSAMLGLFRKDQRTRNEFLSLIGHSRLPDLSI